MPRSSSRKPRLLAGGRVLIMDDEPTILLTLGHYLQALGAEVVPCRQFDAAAAALKAQRFDLVLAGVQSDDYVYSATGGLLAGFLKVPHASVVTKVEVQDGGLKAWRELEGGDQEVVSLARPALLTVQFGINVPRYAPLPAIMKASRQPIEELRPADLGKASWEEFRGPYTLTVRRVAPPTAKGRAEMVPGKTADQAKSVAQLLRDKGFYRG